MTNGARGEVQVEIGAAPRRLCLTLGALAEIETALGVDGLEALGARLSRLGAADLDVVLRALLRPPRAVPLREAFEQLMCSCTILSCDFDSSSARS